MLYQHLLYCLSAKLLLLKAEEAVKGHGIPAVSIFRPGLLERGQKARGVEKVAAYLPFLTATSVQQVASAMISDAVDAAKAKRTGVQVFEEQDIRKMAVSDGP